MKSPRPCETEFNIARHLLVFMMKNPFWAELSRNITKVPTMDIPTAGVTYDVQRDAFIMYYNPEFLSKQSNHAIIGVICHELSHITFGHLVARKRTPHWPWNLATDCAINSLIEISAGQPFEGDKPDAWFLPRSGLVPGYRPELDPEVMAKMSPEQAKATTDLADIIEKLPKLKASEWYFQKIMDEMKSKGHDLSKSGKKIVLRVKGSPGAGAEGGEPQPGGNEPGDGEEIEVGIGELDDHDGWDEVPEELREYVEQRAKGILEKAVNHADQQSDGWGNIPRDIAGEIRRSVSQKIDWRSVLRQFVGGLVRGERTSSIKRINRRYPYIHPGVKRGYTARLLVAIDMSGSVSDKMLETFVAELNTLTKRVSVDILPFDCSANEKDIFEWRKGTRPDVRRTKTGGTDFNAPTRIINDPKNRGRWDGMLICTDGEAPQPEPSRVRRGWVLGEGQKLYFNSTELQVFVDDQKPMVGAWR
jgi:predicted metal-dependent peptidase